MKKQTLLLFAIVFFVAFLSAQRSDAVMTFAIIGDYGSGDSNELAVSKMVDGWNPDFIVTVGDNSYDDDGDDRLPTNVGAYYGQYIFKDKQHGGNNHRKKIFQQYGKAFFTVPGNHDHGKNDKTFGNYLKYFATEDNYHLTMGPCNMYFFDSGKDGHNAGNGKFEDSTLQYLRTVLRQTDTGNYLRLVFFHHPPHCSSSSNPRINSAIDFDTLHVDAVVTGHEHLYERLSHTGSSPQLPLYLVCGTGGASLTEDRYIKPEGPGPGFKSEYFDNHHFGAIKATITTTATGSAVLFQYYSLSDKGATLVDSVTLKK